MHQRIVVLASALVRPSAIAVLIFSSGCVDRARLNTECEWYPEADNGPALRGPDLAYHLDRDVELATELAVRYADAVHGERFGYEGHGGLVEGGELRDRCMTKLLSTIAASHGIPLQQVVEVRSRGRRPLAWDVLVLSCFAAFYVCSSWVVAGWLSRRFPGTEGWAAVVAAVVVSFGVSVAGLQLGSLWGSVTEMLRLGNDHRSGYRAGGDPWKGHLITIYVTGVLLFLIIAGLRYARRHRG